MRVTVRPNVIGAIRPEKLEISGRIESLDLSVVKIGQNTQKSPGDRMKLAATQTPVKDQHLMLLWKNSKASRGYNRRIEKLGR